MEKLIVELLMWINKHEFTEEYGDLVVSSVGLKRKLEELYSEFKRTATAGGKEALSPTNS